MQHHVTVLVPTEQTLTMAVQRETIPHLVLGPLNHAIMFFIFGIAQGIKEPLEPIHPADILRRRIPSPIPKLRIRNVHAAVGTQQLNIMDPIVTITFEKYSIFELHGDELDEPQDLTEYQAGYLPDGAILQDTTKQPNTEPGIVLYKYAINEAESFEIMITQSDNLVYFDTENTKIEPFDKGGVTGYFFQKDGMSYICFERDGCFFSVYGSIDTDELAKIAASITKK